MVFDFLFNIEESFSKFDITSKMLKINELKQFCFVTKCKETTGFYNLVLMELEFVFMVMHIDVGLSTHSMVPNMVIACCVLPANLFSGLFDYLTCTLRFA